MLERWKALPWEKKVIFGGFAVTGADSRTAANDASGGKTQRVSVIGALAAAVVTFSIGKALGVSVS